LDPDDRAGRPRIGTPLSRDSRAQVDVNATALPPLFALLATRLKMTQE